MSHHDAHAVSQQVQSLAARLDPEQVQAELIKMQGVEGSTFLFAAQGNLEALEVAIKDGFDVNSYDMGGATTMHWAAISGQVGVVSFLAQQGANVNAQAREAGNNLTPLMWAVNHRRISTIKELLDLGADLEARDNLGYTALTHACMKGHVHIMHALVKAGADVHVLDNSNHTLLHWAVYKGNASAVEYLRRFHIGAFNMLVIDDIERNAVHWACRTGQLECVRMLALASPEDFYKALECQDDEGKTPLQLAEEHAHFGVVKWVKAMTQSGTTIPYHPMEQRWALLTVPGMIPLFLRTLVGVVVLLVGVTAVAPLPIGVCLSLSVALIAGRELQHNAKKGSAIEAMTLYLPGMWMGITVAALLSILVTNFIRGTEPTPGQLTHAALTVVLIVMYVRLAMLNPGCILGSKSEFEEVLTEIMENDGVAPPHVDPVHMHFDVPRSKYSSVLGCRIGRYDHFCMWLQAPVGYRNHRFFMIFLTLHVGLQLAHLYLAKGILAECDMLHWSTVYYPHPCAMLVACECANVMILLGMSLTFGSHVFMAVGNWTSYESTHAKRLWYFNRQSESPFSRGSFAANCFDFCTMNSRTIGGYGDTRLTVPEPKYRLVPLGHDEDDHGHSHSHGGHGHSHGEPEESIGGLYAAVRKERKQMRVMTKDAPPPASSCCA